jgi:SAM-dependent methyltransferase
MPAKPDITGFYRTADAGAQSSSPHQRDILRDFADQVLDGRRVARLLDLGSGRGSNLGLLPELGDVVVAADVSLEALEESKARYAATGRIDYVVLPGHGVPFATGAFDLSVCTEVLEHVDDPVVTAAELERVTRSGGHLFISTPNYRNVMGAVKFVKDKRSGRNDYDPWHAHAGGFERAMTSTRLRSLFPRCEVVDEVGADYAYALGITNRRLRSRLSKYLLVRPGRFRPLVRFGMQYYVLLRRR